MLSVGFMEYSVTWQQIGAEPQPRRIFLEISLSVKKLSKVLAIFHINLETEKHL